MSTGLNHSITTGSFELRCKASHAARDFLLLQTAARAQVIADITRRMGAGMAKYIEKDVETIADYHEYCHYVAGLTGIGLSQASPPSAFFVQHFKHLI